MLQLFESHNSPSMQIILTQTGWLIICRVSSWLQCNTLGATWARIILQKTNHAEVKFPRLHTWVSTRMPHSGKIHFWRVTRLTSQGSLLHSQMAQPFWTFRPNWHSSSQSRLLQPSSIADGMKQVPSHDIVLCDRLWHIHLEFHTNGCAYDSNFRQRTQSHLHQWSYQLYIQSHEHTSQSVNKERK